MSIRTKAAVVISLVVFAIAAALVSSLGFATGRHSETIWKGLIFFAAGIAASYFASFVARRRHKSETQGKTARAREEQTERIREEHKHTRLMLDAMPFACHVFDKKARLFECNNESIKLFKVKDKQDFSQRFFEFSPEYQPDGQRSYEAAKRLIKKAYKEGECRFEWMHKLPDGEMMPTEVTLVRVPHEDDFAVAAYMRDLREYRQMMKEIEYRDSLLSVVNAVASILIRSETENFESDLAQCIKMLAEAVGTERATIWENLTNVGQAYFKQLYVWSDSEGLQKTGADITDKAFSQEMREMLASGKDAQMLTQSAPPEVREILAKRNVLSVYFVPVFSQGRFWGLATYGNYRCERVFTENEKSILRSATLVITNALLRNDMILKIRGEATKLESVVSNYPGVICSIDKNFDVTLFDGLGVPDFRVEGMFIGDKNLEVAPQADRTANIMERVVKAFAKEPQDWFLRSNDKVYHANMTPILNSKGDIEGVVGSFNDITELNRLQEEIKSALETARKANRAKTSFLASMSHEMRTPLNAIIGLSELTLESEGLNDEAYGNIEKIYAAGSMLLNTVNDILDISKIEAGKFVIVCNDYDVPSLINDTVTQNIMRIGEKPVNLILNVSSDIPVRLNGDELRVKQILNNLISNALKYTKEGTVELSINCERKGGGFWVTAQVRDTGIGIKEEDLAKLFVDDYTQFDIKAHYKIEGTGLGLAITKRILDLMGGSISAESEYGVGSVFTVRFPQKFVSDEVIGQETVESLKNFHYSVSKRASNLRFVRASLPNARVLIVDDVITNLEVARGLMKPYEMRIDCVTSGQQAVDAVREEMVRYNAIFMDHMMPVMDGIEAVRIIRAIDTEYAKTIPIIALTANAIVGNEAMFLNNGFQDFLSKPIDIQRLDAVIKRWVRLATEDKTMPDGQKARVEQFHVMPNGIVGGVFDRVIPGLDIEEGLERFGSEEIYLEVLRSYANSIPPVLDQLKAVSRDGLGDYVIRVHGVKGASRGIGALAVGDGAESLEQASKAGDFDFVKNNNDDLIQMTQALIADINKLLADAGRFVNKPKKDKPDKEMMVKLMEACAKYDMDEVDAVMAEIDAWEYESDDGLVGWVRENVSLSNFAQVREKLSVLTSGANG